MGFFQRFITMHWLFAGRNQLSLASQQIHSAPTPPPAGKGDVEDPGNISKKFLEGSSAFVTLRGRPVDKSRTGRLRATKYIYALIAVDYAATCGITIGLLFYLNKYLYQSFSNAATIANDYNGTFFLLSVLGAFLADSYIGYYVAIVIGAIIEILGLGLLVFTATYSGLQPPACTPTLTTPCPQAGAKYMAPIYVALYTIALGSSFIKVGAPVLGADQFDESDPVEKKQSVHYFSWFYFFEMVGLLLALTLCVYILSYVSKDWGFSWLLIFFVVAFILFLAGTPQYRHKRPGGSFLTRILQVAVVTRRKRKLVVPADTGSLYDAPISGVWLQRSRKLSFLDRAAIRENEADTGNRWMLVGVTQVEETKRILQILPVWMCTWYVSLLFAQAVTFTATQGQTLNRSLTKHFVVPPQSLSVSQILVIICLVPIFDLILRPLLRKVTKNPYGITPLTKIGIGLFSACLAMIVGALVERKRLGYIRDRGLTHESFFELPMTMWWLFPQFFFSAVAEFGVLLSMYEFFYHEVSDNTRSIGLSFSLSALSLGYYLSSVLVNITNSATMHQKGGRWLVERFNDGGLENYYWLLASICGIDMLVFLVVAYFYQYNYTLYLPQKGTAETTDHGTTDHGLQDVE